MFLFSKSFLSFPVSKTVTASGDQTMASQKKGQVSLFAVQEIVASLTTTDFQMRHLSYNLSN